MKGVKIVYSPEELKWVSDNRTLTAPDLCSKFNARFGRDVNAHNLGALKQRNGWRTGRTGRFEKGHIPHPNARQTGPNKTSFKPGHTTNALPIGSSRISKDGYTEIKTGQPATWEMAHIVAWEKVNGQIPRGHCLNFLDGDKTNIDLENLELVSRIENLQINMLRCSKMPEEVRPVVRTLGKLIAKTIEVGR